MSLRIICGRSGTGKTTVCLNEIKQELSAENDDSSLIMLLPEHATFKVEKQLASEVSEGGFMQASVFGFRRFAHYLLLETGGGLCEHITELGKRMMIKRILQNQPDKWQVFNKAARQRNFSEILVQIIEEFKTYGVTPEMAGEAVRTIQNDALQAKLDDLAAIYSQFADGMSGRYQDGQDDMRLLAEKIPLSNKLTGCRVWIDGFKFFNPQELAVIEALLEKAESVTITLSMADKKADNREETALFHRQYMTLQRLRQLAAEHQQETTEVWLDKDYRHVPAGKLAALEKSLSLSEVHAVNGSANKDTVRIVESANRRLETELVAVDILRLCREKKYQWRDITVLVRDMESYQDILSLVLEDAGIPFFNESKRASVHHPLAEFLRSVLEAVDGWQYEPLFRLFKTGFFPVSDDDIDRLENYVLQFGIRGSRWTRDESWGYTDCEAGYDEAESLKQAEFLAEMNRLRWLLINPLMDFSKEIRSASTAREQSIALFNLLTSMEIGSQLDEMAAKAEETGRLAEAREHRQIWDNLIVLFEQIVEACGDENLSLAEYDEILNDGLEGMKFSMIPPGMDYVTIGSVDQHSAGGSKAVYLIGINDGILPRKGKQEGILSDADRLLLSDVGVVLSEGAGIEQFNEQYLIYQALTAASSYLWLSYALSDGEGNELLPSALIHEMRKLLKFEDIEKAALDFMNSRPEMLIGGPRHSLSKLTELLQQYHQAVLNGSSKAVFSPEWRSVYEWAINTPQWKALLEKMLKGLFDKGKYDASLPPEIAEHLYTKKKQLRGSVTRFESFRSCPFKHFVHYGLRLKERKLYTWQAMNFGILLHSAVKKFGDELAEANRQWRDVDKAECRTMSSAIIDKLAEQMQNEILFSSAQNRFFIKKIKETVNKSLERLIEFDGCSDFSPYSFEKAFGMGEADLPPLFYNMENGCKLAINGQIDRLDYLEEAPGFFFVVDYKTGNAELDLLQVYYGLRLQLLTYLLAAEKYSPRIFGRAAQPAGVFYYYLKNPQLKADNKMPAGKIIEELNRQMRLSGWVLRDPKMISQVDHSNKFIKVSLTSKGTINKTTINNSKSEAEFKLLLEHIERVLKNTGEQIMAGDTAIRPCEIKSQRACAYCPYSSICQLEPGKLNEQLIKLPVKRSDDIFKELEDGEIKWLGRTNN